MIEVDIRKKIKIYNGVTFINVNTSFESGRVTLISGPSGAGKTTFLKILAGLIQPEEGVISVDGEVWLNTSQKIFLPTQKRHLGFVFQDYALFPNMTVLEHLLFGTKDQEYIKRLLNMGEMLGFQNHKPKHLSGGQMQRLSILRALSTKPKVLLMDEPFSALDQALKVSLMTQLKDLLSEFGITCLIVSHYQSETEGFAENSFNFI